MSFSKTFNEICDAMFRNRTIRPRSPVHSPGYYVVDDGVLYPLHGIRGWVEHKEDEHRPASGVDFVP